MENLATVSEKVASEENLENSAKQSVETSVSSLNASDDKTDCKNDTENFEEIMECQTHAMHDKVASSDKMDQNIPAVCTAENTDLTVDKTNEGNENAVTIVTSPKDAPPIESNASLKKLPDSIDVPNEEKDSLDEQVKRKSLDKAKSDIEGDEVYMKEKMEDQLYALNKLVEFDDEMETASSSSSSKIESQRLSEKEKNKATEPETIDIADKENGSNPDESLGPNEAPQSKELTDAIKDSLNESSKVNVKTEPMDDSEQTEQSANSKSVVGSGLSLLAQYNSESDIEADSEADNVVEVPFEGSKAYRNKIVEIGSDSESESSSSDNSDVEYISTIRKQIEKRIDLDEDDEDDDDEDGAVGGSKKNKKKNTMRVKGELLLEDLPPIQDLHITVPEEECVELGSVHSIVDQLLLVSVLPNSLLLDLETVLFLDKGKKVLGVIFDVLGQVADPMYCVRFNTHEEIEEKCIKVGDKVYVAPKTEHTQFVILSNLMKLRGSDASWENDVEPPPRYLDYSDDEQEREARARQRNKDRQERSSDNQEPVKRSRPAQDEESIVKTERPSPSASPSTSHSRRYVQRNEKYNREANTAPRPPYQYTRNQPLYANSSSWHSNYRQSSNYRQPFNFNAPMAPPQPPGGMMPSYPAYQNFPPYGNFMNQPPAPSPPPSPSSPMYVVNPYAVRPPHLASPQRPQYTPPQRPSRQSPPPAPPGLE